MSKSAIPSAALDDRLAFVGTSGSGKTYAAGTAVERLLEAGSKVVVVDPLDVWWGLRVKSDGVKPAFPVVIFGGAHGDLPLSEHAGGLLGETIATTKESCIISLGGMATKASERRFMLAFLEKLYRKATGEPFHLIFDEADLWAPQKSLEPQLQNLMENIVRRGRVKGFIPWLITQRPAVLSKDILSQADGLVAMKLTSSQDRDALGAWIEGQADRAEEKRMLAKLPTMQKGHGIVWIPGRGVLSETAFPQKATFDSSSTPKRGETKRTATLKPIDLGKLQERITAIEAEQNKPKAKATPAPSSVAVSTMTVPDPRALRAAEDHGRSLGFDDGKRVGFTEGYKMAQREAQAALSSLRPSEPNLASLPPRPAPAARAAPPLPIASGPGTQMSKAERLILTALAQYPNGRSKTQIAILTGYSSSGGGFNNALSSLRTKVWIEGSDPLRITIDGITALGFYEPLPQGQALLNHWLGQLSKAERAVLQALAEVWPASLTKEQVAETAGYEASGGGFNNALSRLRTLELINGRGDLKASDDLFEEAA